MRRIVSGRRAWTIAVAGLTSTLIPSAAADGHDLARVSGADPFANCTAGDVAGTGFLFPSAEEEPSLSVNPRDHSNIIGAWQQDRWSTGGARGLVAAASHDGGKHFSTVPLPFNSCAPAGLHYDRASDPWISIGPDGTAYGVSISFDAASPRSAVGAASSTDGGLT